MNSDHHMPGDRCGVGRSKRGRDRGVEGGGREGGGGRWGKGVTGEEKKAPALHPFYESQPRNLFLSDRWSAMVLLVTDGDSIGKWRGRQRFAVKGDGYTCETYRRLQHVCVAFVLI